MISQSVPACAGQEVTRTLGYVSLVNEVMYVLYKVGSSDGVHRSLVLILLEALKYGRTTVR